MKFVESWVLLDMSSKPSKQERKEDRIQQLERELSATKKKLSSQSKTMQLDEGQLDNYMEQLTQLIEWSTNRIVDESYPITKIVTTKRKGNDLFSKIIQGVLTVLFIFIGLFIIGFLITSWSTLWINAANKVTVVAMFVIAVTLIALGVDIHRETDRNYLISLFSALVSLVALIVALVK